MTATLDAKRLVPRIGQSYELRLASNPQEIRAAQALRFEVFNLELSEGLQQSYATGLDQDPFDDCCDHLLVWHTPTGQVAGTYRLLTGPRAAAHRGYYSAQEFDFTPLEPLRRHILELGRACVHRLHRNLQVLGLLWKGIADYARAHHSRYLIGCSSLTSQDPAVGASAYASLCRRHLVDPRWRTHALPQFHCPLDALADEPPPIPKLFRAYLSVGAKICGPPALDRAFKTIDFLTFVDLAELPAPIRQRFFTGAPVLAPRVSDLN